MLDSYVSSIEYYSLSLLWVHKYSTIIFKCSRILHLSIYSFNSVSGEMCSDKIEHCQERGQGRDLLSGVDE